MKWVVKLERDIADIRLTFWVAHVYSYARGLHGLLTTIRVEEAHQYCSEATARKAAEAFNGFVEVM